MMSLQLPFSYEIATSMAAALFSEGDKKVLTKDDGSLVYIKDWMSSDKPNEGSNSSRKLNGVRLYLALDCLGGNANGSFSASYQFESKTFKRPDKATVKVWMREGLLLASCGADGKVEGFQLTAKGVDQVKKGFK